MFGQPPAQNFFHGLLALIASPFVELARLITPGFVPDARVPRLALSPLVVAAIAASTAAQKPADILFLASAAFSFAAAALFPALVLGVFWKRAN